MNFVSQQSAVSFSDARPMSAHCMTCAANAFCMSQSICGGDLRVCREAVARYRKIDCSALLSRAGERVSALHIVRSGTFMRYCIAPDGQEHVLGFVMAGEPLDLDEQPGKPRIAYAEALEPAEVCEIPADRFASLIDAGGDTATALVRAMQYQLWRDRRRECLTSHGDARTRLAGFLRDLAERVAERGGDGRQLDLAMARRNIASYLGLTIETVSRCLTAMHRAGEIDVCGRRIRLDGLGAGPAMT